MSARHPARVDRVDLARALRPAGVPLAWLVAATFALLALDNVLLLRFLGKPWLVVAPLAALAAALTAMAARRGMTAAGDATRIGWPTIALCLAIAGGLLLLGGEGRLFYATADWQIRDAVLADMARQPWPFAYPIDGTAQVLRAPIGMYLLPALIGGGRQATLDAALLGCNTAMLALVLAAGSCLFATPRARAIALLAFVAFSGLDIVGTVLDRMAGIPAPFDHLEIWASDLQYSSTITLAFWVPHHAIAGWLCALTYLLWQQRRATIGTVAATIPLVAIWSPLAIMGAVPFAAMAGVQALRRREIRRHDVAQGVLALAVALPGLVYLRAGAAALPSGFHPVPPALYVLSFVLEVGLYLLATLTLRPASRFGRDTLLVVAACLVVMPLWRIGAWIDFQMRASIMPLALLALVVADALARGGAGAEERQRRIVLIALLCIGAATGGAELCRALRERPSPAPRCTLLGIWSKQSGMSAPYSTYLAPVAAMPAPLRPAHVAIVDTARDPVDCWGRPWRSGS